MGELRAPIAGTARHLCIDMQRLFSPQGPWPTPWMERVLPAVLQLVERSPQRTFFTRFIPPGQPDEMPGCWRDYYRKWREVTRERLDPALLELMPELRRLVPPALVLDKMVYSAFADGRLHRRLREDGADTLIVTGSEMPCAARPTALMMRCSRSTAGASTCRSSSPTAPRSSRPGNSEAVEPSRPPSVPFAFATRRSHGCPPEAARIRAGHWQGRSSRHARAVAAASRRAADCARGAGARAVWHRALDRG
jgi:nicotinamidase-related amidase